ncbi:unnamed protein product, partial [Ixodes pacificus]
SHTCDCSPPNTLRPLAISYNGSKRRCHLLGSRRTVAIFVYFPFFAHRFFYDWFENFFNNVITDHFSLVVDTLASQLLRNLRSGDMQFRGRLVDCAGASTRNRP